MQLGQHSDVCSTADLDGIELVGLCLKKATGEFLCSMIGTWDAANSVAKSRLINVQRFSSIYILSTGPFEPEY